MNYQITGPGGVKLGKSTANEVIVAQALVAELRTSSRRVFVTREGQQLEVRMVLADGTPILRFHKHHLSAEAPAWMGQIIQLTTNFWRDTP